LAGSFFPGRSNSAFGNYTNVNHLVCISQKILPQDPVVITTNTGITGANYAMRKLTYADILAGYENGSAQLCGVYGWSPYSVYTDASGFATVAYVPTGPAGSTVPILPIPTYAASIDADSVLATTQAPFAQLNQSAAIRAATKGTFTGTLTNTGSLMTITALGTGTVVTIGALVTGTGVPASTFVAGQTSGTTGGVGVYTLTNAPTTETSETLTIGLQPVTVTQGTTVNQTFGLQYNNADGSFLMDFSATGGQIVGVVATVNDQDPYYNLLSNNCYVDGLFYATFQQASSNFFYTT
jgi:hypothetical protein